MNHSNICLVFIFRNKKRNPYWRDFKKRHEASVKEEKDEEEDDDEDDDEDEDEEDDDGEDDDRKEKESKVTKGEKKREKKYTVDEDENLKGLSVVVCDLDENSYTFFNICPG